MTKTQSAPCTASRPEPCGSLFHSADPRMRRCAPALLKRDTCACGDTGLRMVCTITRLADCDGSDHDLCQHCDGTKSIPCLENDGDCHGYTVDAIGDPTTTKCPTCKGQGRVACPNC